MIGSLAVTDPATVTQWFSKHGAERLVLALDVRLEDTGTPMIATHGWTRASTLTHGGCDRALRARWPPSRALYGHRPRWRAHGPPTSTCIATALHVGPESSFQASGGVRDAADLAALSARAPQAPCRVKLCSKAGSRRRRFDHSYAAHNPLSRRSRWRRRQRRAVSRSQGGRRYHVARGAISRRRRRRARVSTTSPRAPTGRTVDRTWVNRIAAVLDIPFCVAGGIRSVADAEGVLNLGADKISVNSPALERPSSSTSSCAGSVRSVW